MPRFNKVVFSVGFLILSGLSTSVKAESLTAVECLEVREILRNYRSSSVSNGSTSVSNGYSSKMTKAEIEKIEQEERERQAKEDKFQAEVAKQRKKIQTTLEKFYSENDCEQHFARLDDSNGTFQSEIRQKQNELNAFIDRHNEKSAPSFPNSLDDRE